MNPSPVEIAELFNIDLGSIGRGLGDLNGDGRTDQAFGNLVRAQAPSVLLRSESIQADLLGSTEQQIISEYQWNDRGQRIAEIDQEGNVTEYQYYPENDPDGDGEPTFSVYRVLGTDPIGYLAGVVSDARDSPRRNSEVDPLVLESRLSYDPVGNVTAIMDARGVLTVLEVNELNEIVTMTAGVDVSVAVATQELITGEQPFGYRIRTFRDHNGRAIKSEIENRDANTAGVGEFVEQSYEYDILNNIVRTEEEVDATTTNEMQYRYDENENLVSVRQPEGNEAMRTYDERDFVFTITQGTGTADASTVTIDYDQNGNRIRITDAEDNDGDGEPESTIYVYDGFDRRIGTTDPLGNRAVNSLDVADNIVRSQLFGHPAGQPEAPSVLHQDKMFHYDELNRQYRLDEALFVADGFNPIRTPNLLDDDNDSIVTERYEYDALSRITHTIEDDEEVIETIYDGLSREIGVVDALGNMRVTDYDANSNPIRVSNLELSEGNLVSEEVYETHYVYDQLNRMVRATDNAGQTTRFQYDSRNNLIFVSDPVGAPTEDPLGLFPGQINGPGNTSTYFYDGLNRRIAEISELRLGGDGSGDIDLTNPNNPDGLVSVTYAWDGNSRLIAVIDDNDNRTTYTYDSLDRVVSQTNAKTDEITLMSYDRDSNMIELIDPNGTSSVRTFDAINRPVLINVDRAPGVLGTTEEIFEYDGLSRLTGTNDNNGDPGSIQVLDYVYDSLGRVIEEQQNGQAISSVYTGDGKRVEHILPGGRKLTRTFDSIDRIKQISDTTTGNSFVAGMDWIGPGLRLLRRAHGNDTVLTHLNDSADAVMGYDAVKRVTRMRLTDQGGDQLLDREYGYNRADALTFERRIEDNNLTDNYTYDSIYRVETAAFDLGSGGIRRNNEKLEYTYDGVGNRRQVRETNTQTGIRDIDYRVNEVNQYTEIGSVSRNHSNNGNLLDDSNRMYAYDYKNRLVEVKDKGSGSIIATYKYFCDNRRTSKSVDANETRYYYDGRQVCEEQDDTGNTLLTYVYSPTYVDAPIQLERTVFHPEGAGIVYLHQNERSDVVAATNSSGEVVERRFYDDFGQAYDEDKQSTIESSIGNPYGFQGRRLDAETGLYYFRNRYYDPSTGRFLQRDPAWDPNNVGNQYAFVGNSPVSTFDPLGLKPCDRRKVHKLIQDRNTAKQDLFDWEQEKTRLEGEMEKQEEQVKDNNKKLKYLRGRLAGKTTWELLKDMGWTLAPMSSEIDFVRGEGSRSDKAWGIGATKAGQAALIRTGGKFAAKEILLATGGGAIVSVATQWVFQIAQHYSSKWQLEDELENYQNRQRTLTKWLQLLNQKMGRANAAARDLETHLADLEAQLKECQKKLSATQKNNSSKEITDDARRRSPSTQKTKKKPLTKKQRVRAARNKRILEAGKKAEQRERNRTFATKHY